MNSEIRKLLESVQAGKTSVDEALLQIKMSPFEDIGYAKVDLHRKVRQGAAEVIYGAGKTPEQIVGIIETMRQHGQERILITRLSKEAAELEEQTAQDGFWNDLANSQKVQQRISQLKNKINAYNSLEGEYNDALVLIELADEIMYREKETRKRLRGTRT